MNDEFVSKWKSQVKKGTLAFIILNVLKGKELYGYELIESMKKSTSIDIAEGTLYPLMNRLKTEGLVSAKWVEQSSGIPRKYYVLTTTGEAALTHMKAYWNELNMAINKLTT